MTIKKTSNGRIKIKMSTDQYGMFCVALEQIVEFAAIAEPTTTRSIAERKLQWSVAFSLYQRLSKLDNFPLNRFYVRKPETSITLSPSESYLLYLWLTFYSELFENNPIITYLRIHLQECVDN